MTRCKTNLALEEKTMGVLLTRFSRNSPGLRYRDRRRHDEEDEADPLRHPRELNRIGTNLEQTRDLQQRWSGFRWNTTSWQALCTCLVDGGLAGSRTFCTMLAILESAIAFIPRAMITRGMGWANDDAGHGMDRSDPCTRTGIRDPLQPPPSIVRWLPRTQQDRRNANVRIVQRYVIVIRDRFRTWIERINCDLWRSLVEFVDQVTQLLLLSIRDTLVSFAILWLQSEKTENASLTNDGNIGRRSTELRKDTIWFWIWIRRLKDRT